MTALLAAVANKNIFAFIINRKEWIFKVFSDLKPESSSFREKVPGQNCYAVRIFPRFMLEFGLIECKQEKAEFEYQGYVSFNFEKYTRKTPLFDRMLTIK